MVNDELLIMNDKLKNEKTIVPQGRHLINRILQLTVLMLLALPAQAQHGRTVSGKVTEKGEPLPGVTVAVKGTTVAVISDLDGAYSIAVPGPNTTLVFSFLGFTTQEVLVGNRSTIDVELSESIRQIGEVVVVGYGTQKRESVIAAISSISAVALKQTPAANLGVALAGRMPGLTVMQRSSTPGDETMEFYIRGRGTLNGSTPLVLVDGMERGFTNIDPHEVETITILKDASATAVYGVRGANGVILVTTRRGQAGQAKIDVTMEQSWQAPTRIPEMVSAYDYALLSNQVDRSNGREPSYSDYALERYRLADWTELYPVRNFAEEFMHTASPMQHVNVNVSGGTEKMRYFTAVGYLHQMGIFKTEKFDKYDYDPTSKADRVNFRSNVDVNLLPSLNMFLNISGNMTKKNDPARIAGTKEDMYLHIMGSILGTPNNAHNDLTPGGEVLVNNRNTNSGPYGLLNRQGFINTQMNQVASTLGAEQKLDFVTPGLSLKAVVSYDYITHNQQNRSRTYQKYEVQENDSVPGLIQYIPVASSINSTLSDEQGYLFQHTFNVDASVNYARTFGDDHVVTAMALFNRYQRLTNIELPYNYVGYVGRITYAYQSRYLAEFNFGYNGSEQFAPGHKMGFFPSVSVGWVLSEETFMAKTATWLTSAKLRASYGQVGNDQAGGRRFAFLTLWSDKSNEIQIGNPALEWEKANKYNFGLDLRLFNDFSLEGDVFYERRSNILINGDAYVPTGVFGTGSVDDSGILPRMNSGEMENKGFEFVLGYQKALAPDARFDLMFNVAYSRNKILDTKEVHLPADYAYRLRSTGFRMGEHWGYETAGFFNTEQDLLDWYDQTAIGTAPKLGDLKYKDQNGDGIISDKDLVPMGNPDLPEWNFGFGASVQYKGFDFSMMWQAAAGRSFMLNGEIFFEDINFNVWHKEAWSPERYAAGEPITYPRLDPEGANSHHSSDFWLINAAYLRLKNVELGYTLPKKISTKIGATALRVYVNGLNLLTFDHIPHQLWDPEQNGGKLYPIFKTYNVGLNISF
jgi:TonB-linked SusC/RagA family outer membrane protein